MLCLLTQDLGMGGLGTSPGCPDSVEKNCLLEIMFNTQIKTIF